MKSVRDALWQMDASQRAAREIVCIKYVRFRAFFWAVPNKADQGAVVLRSRVFFRRKGRLAVPIVCAVTPLLHAAGLRIDFA